MRLPSSCRLSRPRPPLAGRALGAGVGAALAVAVIYISPSAQTQLRAGSSTLVLPAATLVLPRRGLLRLRGAGATADRYACTTGERMVGTRKHTLWDTPGAMVDAMACVLSQRAQRRRGGLGVGGRSSRPRRIIAMCRARGAPPETRADAQNGGCVAPRGYLAPPAHADRARGPFPWRPGLAHGAGPRRCQ
jgi:hypothetical protein